MIYPVWKNRDAKVLWCITERPDGKVREIDTIGEIAEINACGAGALLIARRVLEHKDLRVPFQTHYDESGVVDRSEDITFCDRVWATGDFSVWAALDFKCAHEKVVDLRSVGGLQDGSF